MAHAEQGFSEPIRSCRICRSKHPKRNLHRWVRQAGSLVEDTTKRQPGRGIYTCSEACAAKLQAAKNKIR